MRSSAMAVWLTYRGLYVLHQAFSKSVVHHLSLSSLRFSLAISWRYNNSWRIIGNDLFPTNVELSESRKFYIWLRKVLGIKILARWNIYCFVLIIRIRYS